MTCHYLSIEKPQMENPISYQNNERKRKKISIRRPSAVTTSTSSVLTTSTLSSTHSTQSDITTSTSLTFSTVTLPTTVTDDDILDELQSPSPKVRKEMEEKEDAIKNLAMMTAEM